MGEKLILQPEKKGENAFTPRHNFNAEKKTCKTEKQTSCLVDVKKSTQNSLGKGVMVFNILLVLPKIVPL